ncbi:MAG: cytochrome b N-terminal domain-containing protein [Bacteroidetes bacterium]|nr:cytochrome b N-terminal domain-containing protein [Bacteroidota bacterium]
MSFWAATVITNLITSVPVVGDKLIILVHGAFSVHDVTLNRFFVMHFLFAILVAVLAVAHVYLLHKEGSSSPVGTELTALEKAQFSFYFASKDWTTFVGFMILLAWFVFVQPNYLNHPDNFIEANPLVTPTHIVPEWYFLPFYAILRAIPNKLLGVEAMVASILLLALLPVLTSGARAARVEPLSAPLNIFFYVLTFCLVMLGGLGAMPATGPYIIASQFFTALYFLSFLLPLLASILARWKKFNENVGENFR